MTGAEKVLNRVSGVKQTAPGRWMARCPAHEDRSASFSIREINDRVLLHCFAGCDTGDVLEAIGLRLSDLFDKPMPHHLAPVRYRFNAIEVLIAVAHEITVATLIAYDVGTAGRLDDEQKTRLLLASERIDRALSLVDLPVPDKIKRLRRGAVATSA